MYVYIYMYVCMYRYGKICNGGSLVGYSLVERFLALTPLIYITVEIKIGQIL